MPPRWLSGALILTLLAAPPGDEPESALGMTPAVACKSIDGYEDFEPLPDASLTSDEKLLVYFRPTHYQVDRVGSNYVAHLAQDAQVRRRGGKAVLLSKAKLLDYEVKSEWPLVPIYLRNTFSLKGLKPGEYDYDIILHDRLGGRDARQTLKFRVVAAEERPESP